MNRSSKGFGLAGVLFAVIVMMLTAFFGARADASQINEPTSQLQR
ncbi:hypothetical protein P2G88_11945 [Aliiglaciecola sp. CAU 1673]|nr:hypothetical protein [Aliiglaciecola sp. CAU 1673]MDF2178962.1 hypothetical protein [Aliiglaciecola sp. CAU 1673]